MLRPAAIPSFVATREKTSIVQNDNLRTYQPQTGFGLKKSDTTKLSEVQTTRGYVYKDKTMKLLTQASATIKAYSKSLLFKLFDQQKLQITKGAETTRDQNASGLMRESLESKCLNSKSSETIDCLKQYSPCTTLAKKPVYLEVEQQTTISEQESEDMFTKPINIRLIDQFNEVFDETDAAGTNDDEHNEVVTNLRTIRRTRHREDMNQLRTLEDSRTVSILQKLCIYAPKIRAVYSTLRSILSEAHSESMILTTSRSVTKYEKFATFTNEYTDQHPTVMMNSDTSTVFSKADVV
jgi:hypothetical protein